VGSRRDFSFDSLDEPTADSFEAAELSALRAERLKCERARPQLLLRA
jgi:hypothetical protein